MGLTFDEAIAKVGTYLKNNDLSNLENNDKFFYIILNDLRQEYVPAVKMTPEQWNEFNNIRNDSVTFSDFWTQVFKQGMARPSISKLSERDLMTAWLDDENVEIIPNMKWFVARKLPNIGGNMLKCSEDGLLMYNAVKEAATQFDTKEEAEKWTNPLTEAVQLPVEDD